MLTHIIVEEEAKGQSVLPVSFLRHLISFYGDSLQVVVPRYLEQTMQTFTHNQEQMRDYLRTAFDGLIPFASFEEMSKQQITIFERTMRMLTPFYGEEVPPADRAPEQQAVSPSEAQIDKLVPASTRCSGNWTNWSAAPLGPDDGARQGPLLGRAALTGFRVRPSGPHRRTGCVPASWALRLRV